MKKRLIIFSIFSCIFFTNCNNSDKNTDEFRKFLKEKFQMVPENGHIYLLVPTTQCKNCILLNGKTLSIELNNKLHIISCLPSKHFLNFKNYHRDKSDEVSGLKLVDYENKFVFYDNDQISFIAKAKLSLAFETDCNK